MTIRVDEPGISIRLVKLVGVNHGQAYRWQTGQAEIDLTPYLGDAGAVRTVKDLYGSSGGFSISLSDREQPESLDTLYAAIEPMDMVEIRMSRYPWITGRPYPLVMRGFVSSVRRAETIAADGSPQRVVVVGGQDEGKLWEIHQMLPETIYASTSPYMDTYRLQAATGIQVSMLPVGTFMTQLVQTVMNDKVAALSAFSGAYVPPFKIESSVTDGVVSPSLVAPFRGPFWNLAVLVADRPWNELFIESRETGPVVVFRPCPFKDIASGALLMPGAADPGTFQRDISAVVSWDVTRTDHRTSNFYWVPPGGSMFESALQVNVASLQDPQLQDYSYGNSARDLFGLRKMEAETRLLPGSIPDTPIRVAPGQRLAVGDQVIQWHTQRALELKGMNRDNVALEEIDAIVQGHEELRPGRYFQLTRGQIVSQSYIVRVSHTYAPLRTWTTGLRLERGDGFLQRDAYSGSPYWAEGRKGPYSPG